MPDTVDRIDIAAFFAGPGPDRDACDAALWTGLKRTGAVIITGYPEAERVDARARAALKLFDQPAEIRAPLHSKLTSPKNTHWYRGYHPCTGERLLQNDFFDMGPEQPASGPDLPGIEVFEETTPLPANEALPGWADGMRAHYAHLNSVAQHLIRSIGRSAGFSEEVIRERFDGEHSTLRLLSYGAGAVSPHPADDGATLSAGRHTDASGLSLLWQDTPGLQAEGQDGVFRDIPVLPNAISVHVGDAMTRLTGGVVPATPHRVLSCEGARRSVGFFLEPASAAAVTPAHETRDPVPVQDTYGWQLINTFAQRPQWQSVIAPLD